MTQPLNQRSLFHAALRVFSCWLMFLGGGQIARSDDAAIVAPFISEPTCVVMKIDTARVTLPPLPDQIVSVLPGGGETVRRTMRVASQKLDAIRTAANKQPIYATVGIPYSPNHEWPAYLLLKQTPQVDAQALIDVLGGTKLVDSCVRGEMLVVMGRLKTDAAARLDQLVPSPRGELSEAFESVADYPVQLLLLPPDFARQTVIDLMPTLPAILGGGPSNVLTDGIEWAAIGADPEKFRVEAVIRSASDEAAQNLADHLPELVNGLSQALPQEHRPSPETLATLAELIDARVEGNRVTIRSAGLEAAGDSLRLVVAAVTGFHASTHQREDMNKVKQIMIAMHNYHDVHKMLPPRDKARDKDGKSGLSWRVHLLPFVEQRALYERFHLDEPWDSPHNKKLITTIPKAFLGGQIGVAPGHTTFQVPVGEDTPFGGPKAGRFNQIYDGMSNTIALVQVKAELAVPWTAPQDYAFDPEDPGAGLQIDGKRRFLIGMFDGSVNRLRIDMKPETLLRLFQKSDGEPIDWDEVR